MSGRIRTLLAIVLCIAVAALVLLFVGEAIGWYENQTASQDRAACELTGGRWTTDSLGAGRCAIPPSATART